MTRALLVVAVVLAVAVPVFVARRDAPPEMISTRQSPPVPPLNGKPDGPALSEVNRLKLQTLAQRIELAQLRAQAAQREFDLARDELQKLVAALKVEGYVLDLQTLTYAKEPPPAPKDKQ